MNDPQSLDPLAAIRSELVAAACRRVPDRASGRPKYVIALAVIGAVLVLAAGAVAVSGVTTGVPAIDRLLDRSSKGDPAHASTVKPKDTRSMSGVFQITLPDGTPAPAVGYESRDRLICTALAKEKPRKEKVGSISCIAGKLAARALAKEPVRIVGGGIARQAYSFTGIARASVKSVTATTDEHRVKGQLSPPWDPTGTGRPIRVFYLFVPYEPDHRGRPPSFRPPALTIESRLANGKRVTLRGFGP